MKQPWIFSAGLDGAFILAPALVISTLILGFRDAVAAVDDLPPWLWAVLIVGVDVAHVYSTLFRTYFDRDELHARRALYTLTPLLCWMAGALLYSVGAIWFWRAIAYLAVFHFVRQQYGFMMIYRRGDSETRPVSVWIDKVVIYMTTLYPLIYWHTHLPRQFDWFVQGDFVGLNIPSLDVVALTIYIGVLCAYLGKEIMQAVRGRINIPKNLLLLGTAVSWWVGIVAFDNDLAFTAVNVLSHGIPYMALIWVYGRNQAAAEPGKQLGGFAAKPLFTVGMVPVLLAVLVLFAYLEEGLWDGLVWSDHTTLFAAFAALPKLTDATTLAWLVPLLALPQLTHYALDGFIWRLQTPNTPWKTVLFHHRHS